MLSKERAPSFNQQSRLGGFLKIMNKRKDPLGSLGSACCSAPAFWAVWGGAGGGNQQMPLRFTS